VLIVATALAVGSVIVIPILAESGALDAYPLLKLPFMPFMMVWPFGPPLLTMILFGMLGRSHRFARIAARASAGFLLYVPLALVMMAYAFSGRLVLGGTDAEVSATCLILGLLLGWFGFTGAGAREKPANDGRAPQ
jgi:hypothetical protein